MSDLHGIIGNFLEGNIRTLEGGANIEPKNITENGTYTAPEGVDGYNPITVNVPSTPPVVEELTATENGTYTAPEGVDGYAPVIVNVPLPQNAYLLKSVPNLPQAIASFSDGADAPMKSLKIAIEPQQEGSGDPSPTNIRPISGWDEAAVSVAEKNKFDLDAVTSFIRNGVVSTQGLTNQDGVITNSKSYGGDGIFPFNYPMTFSSNTITVSADIKLLGNHSSNNVFIQMYNSKGSNRVADGEVTMSSKDTWEHKTITLQLSLLTNVNLVIEARGTNNSVQIKNVQVELGSTPTTYEPHNGQTYTIDLDGTRYGGEVDVINGIVIPAPYYASYNGETLTGEWISDRDKYEVGATPTIGAQVVNIGASGTPVSILPTAVKSLRGVNNVYANTGGIKDVEYFSKEV